MIRRYHAFILVSAIIAAILFLLAALAPPVAAAPASGPFLRSAISADAPDAVLTLADLPGFREAGESEIAGSLALAERLTAGLLSPQTRVEAVSSFRSVNYVQSESVISFLARPLSEKQELEFDALAGDPQSVLASLAAAVQSSGNAEPPQILPALAGIGDKSMGFSLILGQAPFTQGIDFLWVRRGETIQSLWVIRPSGQPASIDMRQLAVLVDQRVEERYSAVTFRPSSELVPDITTHIPTPLDVSTRPSVIGTNLFLAALMMLPFAVAAETFTRLSAENEQYFQGKFHFLRRLPTFFRRLMASFDKPVNRNNAALPAVRVVLIIFFYGLVFSLLDRTWKPFSFTGLVLFLNMTVAYGVVGIADDFIQWKKLKKWGTPADLKLRPSNILIAVVSTITSRLLALVPGLMFGTPEALSLDEALLEQKKRNVLLRISALTFLVIGFGLWGLTIITDLIQRQNISPSLQTLVGGLEAFLLVVFAVALENTFVQMLGLPGSFGEALRKKSRPLWLLGLTMVTFIFYQTLINPRGELAAALEESNVLIFLSAVGAFVLFTFGLWAYLRIRESQHEKLPEAKAEKKTLGKLVPNWAWLAVSIVSITVVTVIVLTSRLGASVTEKQPLPTPAQVSPTAVPAPAAQVPSGLQVSFKPSKLLDKLCYAASTSDISDPDDLAVWHSLQVVAAQYGAQAASSIPQTDNQESYSVGLDRLVQQDCDLIVGEWKYQSQVFQVAAQKNPAEYFMLVGYAGNARPDLPNLWVTEYSLYQGAYMAGYLASAATRTGIVAAFAAFNNPEEIASLNCFILAVEDYNKNNKSKIEALGWDPYKQVGIIADQLKTPDPESSITTDFISQGADIIFPVGGLKGPGLSYGPALVAAQHAGVALVGYQYDQLLPQSEYSGIFYTNVLARYDASIAVAVAALMKGDFNGSKHIGTIASGEIALAPLGDSPKRLPAGTTKNLLQQNLGHFEKCKPSPSLIGILNMDVMGGLGWHPNASLTIRVYASQGGPLLSTVSSVADGTGFFNQHLPLDLKPGMFVEVTDGTDTATETVELLTIDRVDLQNGTVSGTAPPGSTLIVGIYNETSNPTIAVFADKTGHWQADFAGIPMLPGKVGVAATMNMSDTKNSVQVKLSPGELP